jgi:8-oxo-dGTP pyrophosphatase MutT (NUDIX family)
MESVAPLLPPPAARLAAGITRELASTATAAAPTAGRRAAVMIVLYDVAAEPHFLLTKRADDLEHHPGQISLPGGRFDDTDVELETTALRETHEELGIDPASVKVLGRMGDVFTAVSGFVVSPFVGITAEPPEPVPSEREIARVLEVPLGALLAADAALPEQPDILTLRYPLLGEDVWGATARILRAFSAVVRAATRGG